MTADDEPAWLHGDDGGAGLQVDDEPAEAPRADALESDEHLWLAMVVIFCLVAGALLMLAGAVA